MRPATGDAATLLAVAITCDGGNLDAERVTWRVACENLQVLSADERERCNAMTAHAAADLRRAAHVFKREVVAARLGLTPEAVAFISGEGRPRLLAPHHETQVSLSHTTNAIAVAVSDRPVGVDIEVIDRTDNAARVAARYFAPAEALLIRDSADPQFEFAWRWVAKEALLKACGLSLTVALATSPGEAPQHRSDAPFTRHARGARITVLTPAPGYICAVAAL